MLDLLPVFLRKLLAVVRVELLLGFYRLTAVCRYFAKFYMPATALAKPAHPCWCRHEDEAAFILPLQYKNPRERIESPHGD